MTKYKIEFDREVCIGALACNAVAEDFWPRSKDGKVDLTNATYNEQTKKWELIIDEKDFQINQDAAESCPVEAIVVTKLDESEAKNQESTIENNQQNATQTDNSNNGSNNENSINPDKNINNENIQNDNEIKEEKSMNQNKNN